MNYFSDPSSRSRTPSPRRRLFISALKGIGAFLLLSCIFLFFAGCSLSDEVSLRGEVKKLFAARSNYVFDGAVDVLATGDSHVKILSDNPLRVELGKPASFQVAVDEGYTLEESSTFAAEGGNVTIESVHFPTTLRLRTRKLENYSFSAHNANPNVGMLTANLVNGSYYEGTRITLNASVTKAGYLFAGYSLGAPSTKMTDLVCLDPEYTFSLSNDTKVYANFRYGEFTVSLNLDNADGVSADALQKSVKLGSSVEFVLSLKPHTVIDSISEGVEYQDGKLSLSEVRADTEIVIKSHRPESYTFSLDVNDPTGGSVFTQTSDGNYKPGTSITVSVSEITKQFEFIGYSLGATLSNGGKKVSESPDYTFTLDDNTTLYANFIRNNDPAFNIKAPEGKWVLLYHPNGGKNTKSNNTDYLTTYFSNTFYHCPNTLPDKGEFTRAGYALIGYNTKPDGSGTYYGMGWNVVMPEGRDTISLYCMWAKESNASDFTVSGGAITKYTGSDEFVIIPEKIGTAAVTSIKKDAFKDNKALRSIFIPKSIRTIAANSVVNCPNLESLYVTNKVTSFADNWYGNCPKFKTVNVLSVRNPGYIDTEGREPTYSVAWELVMLTKTPKLLIVAGSNAAYGINAPLLQSELAAKGYNYTVINYGTLASTPACLYAEACVSFMNEGDILLLDPEVNEAQYGSNKLSVTVWRMFDGAYDALSYIDVTHYSAFFSSFAKANSEGINAQSKNLNFETYCAKNCRQGGLVWPRYTTESSTASKLAGYEISGGNISFTTSVNYIKNAAYLKEYNRVLDMYAERGATVLTTFASIAEPILTAASKIPGGAEQVALEKAIDTYVHTTRISSIKTYIYPKEYFFNSEYHLLTETSALRTKATATDLIHYFDALKGGTK